MTPTNINFTPKNMLVRSAWSGPPASLRSSTIKKTSGAEVRRTQDVKLRFVGFIRFVSFSRVLVVHYTQKKERVGGGIRSLDLPI